MTEQAAPSCPLLLNHRNLQGYLAARGVFTPVRVESPDTVTFHLYHKQQNARLMEVSVPRPENGQCAPNDSYVPAGLILDGLASLGL